MGYMCGTATYIPFFYVSPLDIPIYINYYFIRAQFYCDITKEVFLRIWCVILQTSFFICLFPYSF